MKLVLTIIRLKTIIACGISSDQRVFIMPHFLTTRYVGMRPPWKNMVAVIMIMRYFSHMVFLRETQYAPRLVRKTLIVVPTAT